VTGPARRKNFYDSDGRRRFSATWPGKSARIATRCQAQPLLLVCSVMSSSAELIQIALAALAVGVALPLLVQLYVTLRSVQRLMATLDRRLDPTLRELQEALATLKGRPPAGQVTGELVAALLPAGLAAVRAFRAHMASAETADPAPAPESKVPTPQAKQNGSNHIQEKRP
jgi:hypothetical protein